MKPWQRKVLTLIMVAATLTGCGVQKADQTDVQRFFSTHKVGSSPDYAVMKNGTDHLLTIYGYVDDLATCMQFIEPYNKDPSLSVVPGIYSCVPLNH